jgi:hypothetical protein
MAAGDQYSKEVPWCFAEFLLQYNQKVRLSALGNGKIPMLASINHVPVACQTLCTSTIECDFQPVSGMVNLDFST